MIVIKIYARELSQRGIDVNNMHDHKIRYCARPMEYELENSQITGYFEQLSHFILMRL